MVVVGNPERTVSVVHCTEKGLQFVGHPGWALVRRVVDADSSADTVCTFYDDGVMDRRGKSGIRQLVVVDEHQDVAVHCLGNGTVAGMHDALRSFTDDSQRNTFGLDQCGQHLLRVVGAVVVYRKQFRLHRKMQCPQGFNQRGQPDAAVVCAEGVRDLHEM